MQKIIYIILVVLAIVILGFVVWLYLKPTSSESVQPSYQAPVSEPAPNFINKEGAKM